MTPKEVVKKSYEAFAAGDMSTLASLCAEDMAVKMGGEMPISGEYNGFEMSFYQKLNLNIILFQYLLLPQYKFYL